MKCTKCLSENIIKYGHTHYGKPRFRCKDCGRQFVENASRQPVSQETRNLIDKLLLERLSLRKCAVCYTDYWQSYEGVLPKKRHKAVGKETGLTSYIERFNNTLRQRVGRLVRKSLSFSKKVENQIGAIWYFIHHYNSEIRALTLP